MGSIGNCCCSKCGCNSAVSTTFNRLKFESLDGLHPVSFENDLWVKNGDISSAIRPNAIEITNPPCSTNYLDSLGVTRWTEPHSILDNLRDSDCCWSALSVPPLGVCRSTGNKWSGTETDKFEYTDNLYYTYDATSPCGTGNVDRGTRTYTHERFTKYSAATRRYVEGVVLKACYVMVGYDLKIQLTATVSYRDWIDIRSDNKYYLRDQYSGRSGFSAYVPLFGGYCKTVDSASSSDTVLCSDTMDGQLSAPIPVRPSNCELCVIPVGGLSTPDGVAYYPGTCASDTVSRSIYIDPNCTIAGTHVFESGLSPTDKVVAPSDLYPCRTSSILSDLCKWPFKTATKCVGNSFMIDLPVAGTTTGGIPTGTIFIDGFSWTFFEMRIASSTRTIAIVTASSPVTTGDTLGTVLMKWWTEPWTITIT